ncbi:VanZ family protein [Clostridium frigidicarnis]|uniref:VanZ like family protein n=1 Tax=Clostridium frigidicarnis TaxID=84698 RepID=A0A1I0Z9P6_9CLOT|nr:VanZ family protein [Clostridium frigidicarnis]SFB22067.1 VanZ like family protein [Clostridium frigidicarnis]
MKMKNRKVLNICLLVTWIVVIFIFSQQDGTESSEKSQLAINILTFLGLDVNGIFGDMADFIVRKGAHMTEYFILCFLAYRVFKDYAFRFAQWIALGFSFLYACSDEFHQTFIPGRLGCFKDVLIDTSGALIFALIITLINKSKERKQFIFR